MPLIDVPTVHAVTDAQILADPEFKSRAAAVFRALGHAGAVHLRAPGVPTINLYRLAELLRPLQDETGCWLVINDRVDIAVATGAAGVHLTHSSLSVEDARHVASAPQKPLRVGVSLHDPSEAIIAVAARTSWVIAGNVYETASHPGRAGKGPGFIRDVARSGAVVIAIGGILPAHVATLRTHGAHGVAAIRGIWGADDPAAAAHAYL